MKQKEIQDQIETLKQVQPRSPEEAMSISFEIHRSENLELTK